MSISSAIQNAQQKVINAYTAVDNKGGTLPATQNLSNLPNAISSIPTATEPTLASLTITPSTTAQTLTPPSGTDGYNTVKVNAVTSAIDSDIVAGNIKSGVNILGVNGSLVELKGQTKTVTPTTSTQTITPDSSYNGLTSIKVNAVTSSIDSNIQAGNIKSGTSILGVTGTVTALAGETRTVSITSTSGNTFTPSSGKNGITSIKCNPTNKALTITPTTTTQTFTVPTNYSGYGTVTCSAGTQPSGTYTITANGTYDVTNYASANVNVSGGGGGIGIPREVSAQGVYRMPSSNFTFSLPSNATDVGAYAMQYAFYQCTRLTSVDLSSLTTVSDSSAMNGAFQNCTNLTSVDLSSLTTVSGSNAMQYAFYRCTGLTSVDLSSLTTVSSSNAMNNIFSGCTGLTSVDLSSLTTVSGSSAMNGAFSGCTGLTGALDLSSLTTVSGSGAMGSVFYGCAGLTSVDLSSLTTVSDSSAMNGAFQSCTGLTSVNFNNLQMIGADNSSQNYRQLLSCFNGCNNLTSITFPKLEKIYCTGSGTTTNGTFANNNKVQKFYFPKLNTITYGTGASSTNQNACKAIFYNCTSLTEIHFGAANQSAIQATAGYSTLWGRGAGNATVYFDL